MNYPVSITITGADERTDLKQLKKLAEEYPFSLELGFLYSTKPMKEKNSGFSFHRYPRREWILNNAKFFFTNFLTCLWKRSETRVAGESVIGHNCELPKNSNQWSCFR